MPKLEKITIEGYKSIKSLKDFELKDINILIGANGAGKSNFLSLFEMVRHITLNNLNEYVGVKGGVDALVYFGSKETKKLNIELFFSNGYKYPVNLLATENNYFSGSHPYWIEPSVHSLPLKEQWDTLKEIEMGFTDWKSNHWSFYHINDTSAFAKIKRVHAENDNLVLKSGGENLAPYLKMLKRKYPQHYENIVFNIQRVFPPFEDFVIRENEEHIQLEWFQKDHLETPFKAHLLSDGTLRFMCLATLLLQPLELMPDIILLDEPELGLHPYAISILAGLIQSVAGQKQFIIATQSADLLNSFSADDIIVVENEKEQSTFRRLKDEDLTLWKEDYSLGELWKSNLFEAIKND